MSEKLIQFLLRFWSVTFVQTRAYLLHLLFVYNHSLIVIQFGLICQ